MKSKDISRIGVIAASYATATLLTMLFLGNIAWGPVQFRISEALCILALFTPEAIPGLTLGCIIANIMNLLLSGMGMLGMFDVVFGSLATCLGALWMWHFRKNVKLALFGPVLFNALIVPAYLPAILTGIGFYTIPFTSISLEGSWALMYAFGFVAIGVGEAVVMYVLGLPLQKALEKTPLFKQRLTN